ncbi:type II secretion system protein [Candidatus Peregrinibacteria bacterium]|nr:type II secretion system protein [Candidatus Peregrinibacteria bacterium]
MKTKKGFTLIELLIVIAIIGILSAALLPTILNAPARGRDAARTGQLNSIVAALEAYNSDFGKYPQADGCIGDEGGETVFVDDTSASVLGNYFAGGTPPQDPSGDRTITGEATGCPAMGLYYYHYVGEVGVAEYILSTVMELENNNNSDTDPTSIAAGTPVVYGGTDYYILVK